MVTKLGQLVLLLLGSPGDTNVQVNDDVSVTCLLDFSNIHISSYGRARSTNLNSGTLVQRGPGSIVPKVLVVLLLDGHVTLISTYISTSTGVAGTKDGQQTQQLKRKSGATHP